jgi:hypothetical protein
MRTLSIPVGTTLNDSTVGGQAGLYGNRNNDGSGGDRMPGLIGLEIEVDDGDARKLALALGLTATSLRKGRYRRVRTKSGSTATPARGTAAFFSSLADEADNVVTPDYPTNPIFAGVYLGTVTAGNYTWIQVDGIAPALFKAGGLTQASAVGNPCTLVSASGVGRFDTMNPASATFAVSMLNLYVAQQAEAAVTDTVSFVVLHPIRRFY